MSAPALAVQGLAAGYGKKRAITDVSFDLGGREVLLVLGHNGAGKTTLIRAIFGLIRPQSGRIVYQGRDITGRAPADNVADGIAFVPQGHGIFRTLSVHDNLELGAYVLQDKSKLEERLGAVFRLFPILDQRRQQTAGTLSGGQQQMLAIGMALMHAPRILILDEPSIGLAPNLVERVMSSVKEVNRIFGTSILMVEQNVRLSLPIADRTIVIKTGQKVYDGEPQRLKDHVELMKLF